MSTNYYAAMIFLLLTSIIVFINMYFSHHRNYHISIPNAFIFEKPLEKPSTSTFLHIHGTIKHLGAAKQIYIINLPYRQDRRTTSIALFQTLHLDAFIVPASNIYSSQVLSRTHLLHKGHITLVELACWTSHMQLWLDIAEKRDKNSWTFIFEDDIDLEMSIVDILASFPSDLWNKPEMIYLGYCGDPRGPIIYEGIQGYRVHQAINPSCTHAYAIRSSTSSKLLHYLSSPKKAIDDEIVELVEDGKLLVYSIHPPLALQQKTTSSHPSDVNPTKNTWIYRIHVWINYIHGWWNGVEFIDELKDSALARSDLTKANEWRMKHEHGVWQNKHENSSFLSHVL